MEVKSENFTSAKVKFLLLEKHTIIATLTVSR